MALAPATRLGPYEILSPIGAGGMGEVYRAKDTRLGREVAVKVLPEHLSASLEVRQRFEREARAASSLSHPHICALYDVGHQEGIDFLVMELLEGETLAVRLKKGPLPPAEALRFGVQIAGALEVAHKAGFVHRDIKPSNVMITRSGAKLLDFGLARSLSGVAAARGGSAAPGVTASDPLSASPTVARPLTAAPTAEGPLTSQGAILGTYQYMAPEQIEGREADPRTDIFAFGLVLYEMLTGHRAFEAQTQASLIAEIMKGEPRRISAVAGASPEAVNRIIFTCICKDPEERFQSIHDVRLHLEWIVATTAPEAAGPSTAEAPSGAKPKGRRLRLVVTATAVFAAVIGWISFGEAKRRLSVAARPVAFSFRPSGEQDQTITLGDSSSDFAISPDGRRLAFVASDAVGVVHLWLREMDALEPHRLQGTEDAEMPFWSPDSQSIGFFSQGKVKKIAAGGGPPQVLCDWKGGNGGTWNEGGVILFGGEAAGGGIMKITARGGTPERITTVRTSEEGTGFPESARHEWPVFLPDGERFIYLQFSGRTSERAIFVATVDGGEPVRLLATGFKAEFVKPDWLIFVQRSSLMAQRVDLGSLSLRGGPAVILDGIEQAIVPGMASFSVSPNGHLAFGRRNASWRSQLTWYKRDGTILGTVSEEGAYVNVSLSPDGRTVSVAKGTGEAYDGEGVGEAPVNIWNVDLDRGITSRFTSRPATSDENPVWSPDGKRIAYASHQKGVAAVYLRDAGAAGEESLLYSSDQNPHPIDWSPDGRYLLLHAGSFIGDDDLIALDLENPGAGAVKCVVGPGDQVQGQFSPDGRWIAYASDEGGASEVFVRPFHSGDGRWQISGGGGQQPRWRDDGRELYYVANGGTIMAVEIAPGPVFRASAPVALFKPEILNPGFLFYGGQASYDVAPGGQRFLINREIVAGRSDPAIDIILNWAPPETESAR